MFIKLFNGSTSHLQNIKIITLYKIHQSPELWNQTRKPFKLIFHLSIKMHGRQCQQTMITVVK